MKKQGELAARVEALEAQVKALVGIVNDLLPAIELTLKVNADPYSAAFVKFRARAEEHSRVLRKL